MSAFQDLTGQKFGKLTVIERAENLGGRVAWACRCECGKVKPTIAALLKNGHSKSCGCEAPVFQDLAGQVFGMLTVIERVENRGVRTMWSCQCECGVETEVGAKDLKNGKSRSCGCNRGAEAEDLTGQKFGKLKVVQRSQNKKARVSWECLCDCGKTSFVSSNSLKTGNSTSCGCYKSEWTSAKMTKHGHSKYYQKTPEYSTWKQITQRTSNPNAKAYPYYGGRGITMCDRWKSDFQNFFDDMGPKPSPAHSIERKDNSKGYFFENCCWASSKEQGRNKRNNIQVEYQGETKCLAEWSEILGIRWHTLRYRIVRAKWPAEKAFETPVRDTKP